MYKLELYALLCKMFHGYSYVLIKTSVTAGFIGICNEMWNIQTELKCQ